jgi:glycosyltransferase involved in cell wall biosynthesis
LIADDGRFARIAMSTQSNATNTRHLASTDTTPLPPITCPYLLVINVPLYRNGDELCAGQLWFKDLVKHIAYLERFSIACPHVEGSPAEVAVPLKSDSRLARVTIVALSSPTSVIGAIFGLPVTMMRLWRAIRKAELVHTGIAGWPIPYGWLVTPLTRLLRKKLVIIVESAPWRIAPGMPSGLKSRLRAGVYERLARWCVSRSDLAIFTQEEYRQSLLRKPETGHVIHASWIDENVIVSDSEASAMWREKLNLNPTELTILFAGRLDPHKGVAVLLDAIRRVARKSVRVRLDVLGSGELATMCKQVSSELSGPTRVRILGTVGYEAPFFELVRRYHAVIVPSISDEQPRIVYDAYSQGVPVLGTRTAGLRDCIYENLTGWLVEPNSVDALSCMIERAASDVAALQPMGMEALRVARSMTHQKMHRERQRLLLQMTEPRDATMC